MENDVKYTKENIEWIRKGLKTFYPSYFYPPDEALRQPFTTHYEGYHKSTFINYVFLITSTNDISNAIGVLDYWLELLAYPEANMPEEIIEAVKEIKETATKEKAQKEILEKKLQRLPQTLQAKKQEIPQPKEVKERQPYSQVPREQVVVVTKMQEKPAPEEIETPTSPTPTVAEEVPVEPDVEKLREELQKPLQVIQQKNPQLPNIYVSLGGSEKRQLSDEEINYIRNELIIPAHKDPRGFSERVAQSIIENAPEVKKNTLPEQLKVTADFLAIDFTDKLLSLNPDTFSENVNRVHPIEILSALANPNNPQLGKIIDDPEVRKAVCAIAQETALTLDHDSQMASNLLSSTPSVGQDIANYFYSFREKGGELSTEETPNSAKIEVDKLVESFRQSAKVKWEVYSYLKKNNPQALQEISKNAMDDMIRKTLWHQRSESFAGRSLAEQLKQLAIAPGTYEYEYYQTNYQTKRLLEMWAGKNIPLLLATVPDYYPQTRGDQVYIAYFITPPINSSFGDNSFDIISYGGKVIFRAGLRKGAEKGLSMLGLGNVFAPVGEAVAAETAVAAEGVAVTGAEATAVATGTAAGVVPGIIAAAVIVAKKALSWVLRNLKKLGNKIGEFLTGERNKEYRKLAYLSLFLGGFGLFSLVHVGIAQAAGVGLMATSGLGVAGEISLKQAGIKTATTSQAIMTGLTAATVSFGTPLIIALISIPILIAVFLFIINSGAYIVPPNMKSLVTGPGVIESPYIEVLKNPNPTGPFKNDDLTKPLEVEYSITVRAKKGTLSNIQIEYTCSVSKDGPSPPCPKTDPIMPTEIQIPSDISPTNPFTFTYKQRYDSTDFEDSFVLDTITVTADVPDQQGTKSSGSAIIKIGTPPENCPSGWPVSGRQKITQGPRSAYSHSLVEAIDLGVGVGTEIRATHSGVATVVYTSGDYRPLYVDIISTCGGITFSSRYAHLSATSITNGQQVTFGQAIGVSGSDGTGPHLHYEFRGLKMAWPFIPTQRNLYGCYDVNTCGYTD